MQTLFHRWLLGAGLVLASLCPPALAQDSYPSRPIRFIVPLPPGGPSDHMARLVAQGLSAQLGQPVVVDNRPGAEGAIALREAMAAAPDGHTWLYAIGSMIALPLRTQPPTFNWLAELAPVGTLGRVNFCLMVHPEVPARTVAELVAYARAHPDQLNYAASTLGELMAASQFMKATGTRMTRVPYKGGAQAMPDLLAGRVQLMFGPQSLAQAQLAQGGVRVLATLLPQRSPTLPEVPTLAEAGYPGVSVPTWQSMFVPAKTPGVVVDRLQRALQTVLSRPELRSDLERRALSVERASPEELAATVGREQALWTSLLSEHPAGLD
jgi:tripartite-type tricarboxylate transporter receptor subunit TctC